MSFPCELTHAKITRYRYVNQRLRNVECSCITADKMHLKWMPIFFFKVDIHGGLNMEKRNFHFSKQHENRIYIVSRHLHNLSISEGKWQHCLTSSILWRLWSFSIKLEIHLCECLYVWRNCEKYQAANIYKGHTHQCVKTL